MDKETIKPLIDSILNQYFSISDVNETPLNPCQQEILVDEAVSDGYVVWTFEPHDPDNERYEIEKRLKLSSAYPKQLLSVSMTSGHANIPFHIVEDTYLVKSGVSCFYLVSYLDGLEFGN